MTFTTCFPSLCGYHVETDSLHPRRRRPRRNHLPYHSKSLSSRPGPAVDDILLVSSASPTGSDLTLRTRRVTLRNRRAVRQNRGAAREKGELSLLPTAWLAPCSSPYAIPRGILLREIRERERRRDEESQARGFTTWSWKLHRYMISCGQSGTPQQEGHMPNRPRRSYNPSARRVDQRSEARQVPAKYLGGYERGNPFRSSARQPGDRHLPRIPDARG